DAAEAGVGTELVEVDEVVGVGRLHAGGAGDDAGRLPAGREQLPNGVRPGGKVGEGVAAVRGGDGRAFSRVELAGGVGVEGDRAAGLAWLAGLANAGAAEVIEGAAADDGGGGGHLDDGGGGGNREEQAILEALECRASRAPQQPGPRREGCDRHRRLLWVRG